MSDPSSSPASGAAPTENERTWGMLAHLSALVGVSIARSDQSAFVAAHAKEALNFNISVTLAAVVCALLMLVFVGFLLGSALFIAWLVMTLIAAIKASEGAAYRYPFSLRLVS